MLEISHDGYFYSKYLFSNQYYLLDRIIYKIGENRLLSNSSPSYNNKLMKSYNQKYLIDFDNKGILDSSNLRSMLKNSRRQKDFSP